MGFFAQQTLNGVVLGSVYALYALGFGLVLANLRIFHVAHAGVFTWGAIVSWQLTTGSGLPLVVAMPVAALLGGLLNVAAYAVFIRHLVDRRDRELAAFISSVGGLIVLVELAGMRLQHSTVRLPGDVFPVASWTAGPLRVTALQLTMVLSTALLVAALGWLVRRTQFGRELRAVAYNRQLAALLGADVDRVSAAVFFLSGALAAIAATLVAVAFNVVDSHLGQSYLLIALAAMVVGGFGSVIGVLVGGILIGLASSYSTAFLATSYRDLAVFGLLLLFLALRPSGIFRGGSPIDRV